MTAAAGRVDTVVRVSEEHAIPFSLRLKLASAITPFRHWLLARSAAGFGVVPLEAATGATGQIAMGAASADVPTAGGNNGDANVPTYAQWLLGYANSAGANDGFVDADFGSVAWFRDNQTIGKLSNLSGKNRSMAGVFMGLDVDQSKTVLWTGPAGWFAARTAHLADHADFGTFTKAVDAGAATDLAEDVCQRPKLHGTIQAVEFMVSGATLAASGNTDFKTMTISKRDGAGGNAVVVATADSKATAWTQWTAVTFTLSAVAGAIDILETDLLTVVESHGGNGAVLPAGKLRVIGKAC